jgi:Mrp family chromosome partitioning ATPase
MVEKLKAAIEKAREQRLGGAAPHTILPSQPPHGVAPRLQDAWSTLESFEPRPKALERGRIVSSARSDPATIAFDVLRTRLTRACHENGWRRVGVTSPTQGCGKSMVSANLAFSIARRETSRVLLVDMDLKLPTQAKLLGWRGERLIEEMLRGRTDPTTHLVRVGQNFAVALNTRPVAAASELIHNPMTAQSLDAMIVQFDPDIVIYDMPPMLIDDQTTAFLPNLDCILMVAGAGATKAAEVRECERLLDDKSPLLGVVLNKVKDGGAPAYQQAYSAI